MSKAFCFRIRLRVLAPENFTLSKFLQGYKLLVAKNGNSFVNAD